MSTSEGRRLEAWLLLAGMLAGMAWYARPQLAYSLDILQGLIAMALK